MPPKQDAVDLAKSDVTVLCNILMSVTDLKLDHKGLAPILGLTSAKNVPRSLNVRLKPYGFEYKSGTIFQIGQEPAASGNDEDEDGESAGAAASTSKTKKTKAPKTPKVAKAAKTHASKKRKLAEAAEESDDAAEATAEVGAVIKDEGNNSDVEA